MSVFLIDFEVLKDSTGGVVGFSLIASNIKLPIVTPIPNI